MIYAMYIPRFYGGCVIAEISWKNLVSGHIGIGKCDKTAIGYYSKAFRIRIAAEDKHKLCNRDR